MGYLKPRHIFTSPKQQNKMLNALTMELLMPEQRECVLRDAFGWPHV
jgi:hypothetical protein